MEKNAVAVVLSNSHCKEEVDNHVQEETMIISMFLFLPRSNLDIFATGKRVNHGGEYRLEISVNFQFSRLKKTIKLAKK